MKASSKRGQEGRTAAAPRALAALACCALLAATPAQAGVMDKLFGADTSSAPSTPTPPATRGQRSWPIRDFTRVELVPREAGAPDNQQPAQLSTEALRQQLAQIEFTGPNGRLPLFTADEIGDLATPLVQALGNAGPGDDVLLLSSYRREGGILVAPKAVTARIFVQGGSLQIIVNEARHDFYDLYRGTDVRPKFTYGSRTTQGVAVLHSTGATNRRPDWISIPLQPEGSAAASVAPAAAPPPSLQATPTAAQRTAPVGALPAPRPAVAPARADDFERRLETLQRLHEKHLITEDEYQQKRKEILQQL